MPRRIIKESHIRKLIREAIKEKVNEAMMDGFSFDALKGKSFSAKVKYCQKMCGKQIGGGSSRVVFQIDDQWVLKLAKNPKGIAQNEEEFRIATDGYGSGLSVKVDESRSDTEGYEWLVSEYVLPAKAQDFRQVCGIEWKDIETFAGSLEDYRVVRGIYEKYADNERATDLLNEIYEYWGNWDGALGDVARLANWGMVRRDGDVEMVLLDLGASRDIIKQYYR